MEKSSKPEKAMMWVGKNTPGGGFVIHAEPVTLGAPLPSAPQAVALIQQLMALPRKVSAN